jgi:hypothetical protein
MSADFFFGVVIGFIVVLVGVAALLIYGKEHAQSHGERGMALMRERNRIDEDKLFVLKGMSGWIAELVEVLKDAALVENLPSSASLAAESAAHGTEKPVSGGYADGGEPLSREEMDSILAALRRRYGELPETLPASLFDAVMDLEAQREVRR